MHEWSFHLELPGETPSREGAHWRRERDEEMRRMRRALTRYRRVMQLADKPPQDRGAALEALAQERVEDDPCLFEEAISRPGGSGRGPAAGLGRRGFGRPA